MVTNSENTLQKNLKWRSIQVPWFCPGILNILQYLLTYQFEVYGLRFTGLDRWQFLSMPGCHSQRFCLLTWISYHLHPFSSKFFSYIFIKLTDTTNDIYKLKLTFFACICWLKAVKRLISMYAYVHK